MTESLAPPRRLEQFAAALLESAGTPADLALIVARHLVGANLAGHDSHGVLRLTQYVQEVEEGRLRPDARPQVVREMGAVAVVDGGGGYGQVAARHAMEWACERAGQTGIAAAAVRRANHLGRLGEYTELAVERGLIGIATVGIGGGGAVQPFGGTGRFLGTNPWSIGVPGGEEPFIFDAATSAIAEGKVRVALAKGVPVPAGAIVDDQARPTTQAAALYDGGALLPMGGDLSGHKGTGLALAAALVGALAIIDDTEPTMAGTFSGPAHHPAWLAGAATIAIRPDAFGDGPAYREKVGSLLDAYRALPGDGNGGVLVAGDPERRRRQERAAGIPLPEATRSELNQLAARYGVGPLA